MTKGCRPRRRRFLLAATAGGLLAGCAPIGVVDVSSSHYRLPASTTVVVRQTITIPPGTAHVTLQDGRIITLDQLRRYEPFCEIEVNDVLESEQQVRPGRFPAVRIIRQQLIGKYQPVLLAANIATEAESAAGTRAMLLAALDDTFRLNEVRLQLHSPEQMNVRELRCAGGWAFTSNVAFPTLAEMNRALGAFVSIEIN